MSEPEFIELDESDITTIDVYAEPLELYKLLKIANLVNGGGEAKMLIADGFVGLNGELCQQKRRKIYQGDLVEFNGEFLQIRLVDESDDSQSRHAQPTVSATPQEPTMPQGTKGNAEKNRNAKSKNAAKSAKAKSGKSTRGKATSGKTSPGKPRSKKKPATESKSRSPSGRRSISF